AEHIGEQQHEHDRLDEHVDLVVRHPPAATDVAPRDGQSVVDRLLGPYAVGTCRRLTLHIGRGHDALLPASSGFSVSSSACRPVSFTDTSSRVGRRSAMSSMVMPASSRSRITWINPLEPVWVGTVSLRLCSSCSHCPPLFRFRICSA